MQVGHIINYKQPKPEVGMGLTVLHYTDRSAATIVKVSKSGKTIWFRGDIATRVDNNGMSESQEYTFQPNPEGKLQRASLRQDGQWRIANGKQKINLGHRDAYHDYSF